MEGMTGEEEVRRQGMLFGDVIFLKTGATLDRGDLFIRTRMKNAGGPVNEESAAMIDSLVGRWARILNFSGQIVASDILMSDDIDNVVLVFFMRFSSSVKL
ncbi:hypothetical protein Taro_034890, partial [Colocasia esculenta]|nr:hypothetical protein [Colocasia esculenta]